MLWYNDCKDADEKSPLHLIPLTSTSKNSNTSHSVPSASDTQMNGCNIVKLSGLISNHPEMILVGSHEVKIDEESNDVSATEIKNESSLLILDVIKQESSLDEEDSNLDSYCDAGDEENEITNQEGENEADRSSGRKTLKRTINLIDISARFLSCYTGFAQHRTPISFLKADENSLKAIYIFAVMLRSFIKEVMLEIDREGLTQVIGKEMKDMNINGLCFTKLLPTPSKQLSLLRSALKKNMREFTALNMKPDNVAVNVLDDDVKVSTAITSHSEEEVEDLSSLGVVTFD